MKKTLLFTFAILFATATMAQNRAMFINESFDGNGMPAGWTVAGLGTSNWSVSQTSNAGGLANELHMYWDPQFNGISRVVMPAVDLTGVSSVKVSFKHALDNYSGSSTIGIATSSDGGTTWNVGWSQAYTNSGTWSIMQDITTTDMGQPNVKFCLYYSGNSYNMNDWYFDNIQIFTLENLDLGITALNLPGFIASGDQALSFSVMNFGVTPVTTLSATYEVEGYEPVNQTFTTTIASLSNTTLTFDEPINLRPGDYHITLTLNAVNGVDDDELGNNSVEKDFSVAIASAQRYPMVEHFTSSTCPPCVAVNNQMLNLTNNNPGLFTYTKYQMNWPGNGDPYYTAEGGVRRTYYGISAVPSVFIDSEANTPVTQPVLNQHIAKTAFMDIKGSFNVEGNSIHVIADVMPYIDVNARVYITVNEKLTTGNVGSNGETQFRHVMMKMLPNAQGSTVNFVSNELQRLEFTQDMSSTHVEEMSDLEVAIFVQNYNTKEVYNSRYAYEYTDIHPYPVENLTVAADRNNITAAWNAPTEGNPTGYNVYVNGELVAENTTETSYSFEGQANMFYVVGVEALYPNDQISVKIVAAFEETLQDQGLVTEEHNFVLNEDVLSAEVSVSNANHNTQADINILSIEETNAEGVQYLTITAEELPFVLPYGEDFSFVIEPNYLGEEKSVAQTKIVVTSDAGVLEFEVEVDGEVLSVTDISAKAKIYPNPANASVCVEAENGIESVNVYNVLGALIETIPANAKTVNVNLSNYSNGVYFFNIRQSDGTVSNQRVVVNH